MSDFLIMFLLYSCLSSVGCWSIKWRMRLKGGLSLHKQSSRVPGKSSFLTLISLGKYITKTRCGISRWHMSCLLSELKQIPALGWPGRTGVPGHWLWCPRLWLAPIWAMLCPEGPIHCSAPCPRTSWALLALPRAGCWPGHGAAAGWSMDAVTWSVDHPPLGQPAGATPVRLVREGRSKKLPCYLSMCTFTQALQLGAPGCLCTLGAPLQLPKKCLQGSGLQAAIS